MAESSLPRTDTTDAIERARKRLAASQKSSGQEIDSFDWWDDFGEDIVYPGIGAAIGAALPIPFGATIGTIGGEYAAAEGEHGLGRLGTALMNTGFDVLGGKALKMAGKTKMARKFLDPLEKVTDALGNVVDQRLLPGAGNPASGALLRKASETADKKATDRLGKIAGRGHFPGGARPRSTNLDDIQTFGRPIVDKAQNIPFTRNGIEEQIKMSKINSIFPSKRAQVANESAVITDFVDDLADAAFPGALENADFGTRIGNVLAQNAQNLKKTDAAVWDLVSDPRWTGTRVAKSKARKSVQELLDNVDARYKRPTALTTDVKNKTVKAVTDLMDGLKTGEKDMLDIDIVRTEIGNALSGERMGGNDRRVLGQLYHGLRDVQEKIIDSVQIPEDLGGGDLVAKWRANTDKWKAAMDLDDYAENILGGARRYESLLPRLMKDQKALTNFMSFASDNDLKTFAASAGANILEQGKSLNAVNAQWKKLTPLARQIIDRDYGRGSFKENLIRVAAVRDIANYEARAAASATKSSLRPKDWAGVLNWAITGVVSEPVYKEIKRLYPKILGYERTGTVAQRAAATMARSLVKGILASGGAAMRETTENFPMLQEKIKQDSSSLAERLKPQMAERLPEQIGAEHGRR